MHSEVKSFSLNTTTETSGYMKFSFFWLLQFATFQVCIQVGQSYGLCSQTDPDLYAKIWMGLYRFVHLESEIRTVSAPLAYI